MRALNFALAVTFLVIAALQVNADEPVRWILIFGTMSVVCIFAMFRYFPRAFLFSLVGLFTLYAAYLFFRPVTGKLLIVNGFAGLLGCIVLLIVQVIRSYRDQ